VRIISSCSCSSNTCSSRSRFSDALLTACTTISYHEKPYQQQQPRQLDCLQLIRHTTRRRRSCMSSDGVVVIGRKMPSLRSYVTVLGSFFEYDTAKVVHIPSKKVGIINRLIQAAILFYIIGSVFTRYRTAGVGMRGRSPSLYHSRQCGIVVKPRLDCPGYIVVCFMTHDCSRKL